MPPSNADTFETTTSSMPGQNGETLLDMKPPFRRSDSQNSLSGMSYESDSEQPLETRFNTHEVTRHESKASRGREIFCSNESSGSAAIRNKLAQSPSRLSPRFLDGPVKSKVFSHLLQPKQSVGAKTAPSDKQQHQVFRRSSMSQLMKPIRKHESFPVHKRDIFLDNLENLRSMLTTDRENTADHSDSSFEVDFDDALLDAFYSPDSILHPSESIEKAPGNRRGSAKF